MKNSKKIPKYIILLTILLLVLIGITTASFRTKNKQVTPQPIVHDESFGIYTPPHIPKKDIYSIVMVGDSMTEALGPHGGKLSELLNTLYQSKPGNQRIVIDNYATGSTNLLGLQEAMRQKKSLEDQTLDPLLSRQFDVILIESFGYNPLSQLGLEGGIKKQTQTLDQLMKLLITTHPHAVIIFVATIAPNKETYAKAENPGESTEGRIKQAEERMDYINNHIAYAKAHHIPLIDIYNKSLTLQGDGDLAYINPNDNIHPSFKGVDFISNEIANFIYNNQILQK